MKTILLDVDQNLRLAVMRYQKTDNLLRNHKYNIQKMWEKIGDMEYNLFNQNIFVGLLQNLSIDPSWTLEYVIAYTKLRSRSLCSAFGIASQNNKGVQHPDTLFYGKCKEFFVYVENSRDLTKESLYSLKSIFPIYSTITTFTYLPTAERERNAQMDYQYDTALVGVNLVELAVGWWMYMNDPRFTGHGIHQYLGTVAFPNFELIHNQLAIFNSLYSHIVNKVGYSHLLEMEKLTFNTLVVRDMLIKLLEYMTIQLKSNSFKNHKVVQAYLKRSDMMPDYDLIFGTNGYDLSYNENVIWPFELASVKYFILHFTLMNELSIIGDDMRGQLMQLVPLVRQRWQRIKDSELSRHAVDQITILESLLK